jgi:hypothetical protein
VNQPLTEWLRLMLDEIARKRVDSEQAAAERRTRAAEASQSSRTPQPGREPAPASQ